MVSNLLERRGRREYLSDADWTAERTAPPSGDGAPRDATDLGQPSWIRPTIEALEELLALPPNWNSYNARPVERHTIGSAFALLRDAAGNRDFPAPIVVPTNRGGIQFEWHTNGIDLEIEAKPAGRYHIFFEDTPHGREREGDFHSDLQPLVDALDEFARHA